MPAVQLPEMGREKKMKEITWDVNGFGCWICNSHAKDQAGYPKTCFNGKTTSISRIMYQKYKGEIPTGLFVLHDCPGGDNPGCINPEHLRVGTHQENMNDKKIKRVINVDTNFDETVFEHRKKPKKSEFWQRVAVIYNKCNVRKISPMYACNVHTGCHPSATTAVMSQVEIAIKVVLEEMKSEGYDFSII